MKSFIKLHPDDFVVVALVGLKKEDYIQVDGLDILLNDDVPKGHKIAIKNINKEEDVIKYGYAIGRATTTIKIGDHVHTHNLKTNLSDCLSYEYEPILTAALDKGVNKEVKVYHRANGDIGIRNELWIIPTVGCVNKTAEIIRDEFMSMYDQLKIDGVYAYSHPFGCSQLGYDHMTTQTILKNIALHPNCGGVLILGLGCENNQVKEIQASLGAFDSSRVKFLVCQDVEDEITSGVELLNQLYEVMQDDKRMPGDLSQLRIGLKCGGSDGLSGITANPLLGYFSDYIVANGGTTVLSEVPEMFGAETILMNRAQNVETFDKIVTLINSFKNYYKANDAVIYENPSPGNKAGGITTLEDKSLGCTQKAGTSAVVDVIQYGERLSQRGLNLLQGPGNDLVAVTALGSAGCHLVLFTTGRGTPFGGFVPTVKIATNYELATQKNHWIDFDASQLLRVENKDEVVNEFIDEIVSICNGKKTKNERYNHREIDIWKFGVTL